MQRRRNRFVNKVATDTSIQKPTSGISRPITTMVQRAEKVSRSDRTLLSRFFKPDFKLNPDSFPWLTWPIRPDVGHPSFIEISKVDEVRKIFWPGNELKVLYRFRLWCSSIRHRYSCSNKLPNHIQQNDVLSILRDGIQVLNVPTQYRALIYCNPLLSLLGRQSQGKWRLAYKKAWGEIEEV